MWKDVINEELIIINPKIKNKAELFEKLATHLYNNDLILNRKVFLQNIINRENLANTEVSNGIALPHYKGNTAVKLFAGIIILPDGIDWEHPTLDKVKLIMFFGTPENQNKRYLQLIAHSARLLRKDDFIQSLINIQKANNAINILKQHDIEYTSGVEAANYLMIVTLYNPEYLAQILELMVEVGIDNASIVESLSMAKKLAYDIPLFAGSSLLSREKDENTNIIMASIQNKRHAQILFGLLKENNIDFDKKGNGFIQLIKLEMVLGNPTEDIDI